MNINLITDERERSSYGERFVEEVVVGLKIVSEDKTAILTYDSDDKLKHKKYGYYLDVDVTYYNQGNPITVEVHSDSLDEYGYNQWTDFDNITELKKWLNQNAIIE